MSKVTSNMFDSIKAALEKPDSSPGGLYREILKTTFLFPQQQNPREPLASCPSEIMSFPFLEEKSKT